LLFIVELRVELGLQLQPQPGHPLGLAILVLLAALVKPILEMVALRLLIAILQQQGFPGLILKLLGCHP
jgi:hypothetical protein